jgi:replicative DNA helicase
MEKQVLNKELQTLAAVLKDGDVATFLTAEPELFDVYGDVYEFVVKYYSQHKGLPPAQIVEQKFNVSFPEVVGATDHHLTDLRNENLKRRLREIVLGTSSLIQDGKFSAALTNMIGSANELRRLSVRSRDVDATDIESAIEHIKKVQQQNADGSYGVRFGIPGIDDFLPSGVIPGMFGLIMGYPGRGKSFLASLLAVRAWEVNKKVLYISLEMTENEVRARVYAIIGNGQWSLRKLQRGQVSPVDFEVWAKAEFEDKGIFPIVNNDGVGRFTPSALQAKIEEYNPDIVFVDYLQLMAPDSGNDSNETIKLKTISQDLKALAMSSRTAIIGVVSATPADATDMDSVPELGQVAWSKQLSYDADFMLAVGRADNDPLMTIAWRKNRNGPLTDFALKCDFDNGIFTYLELDFQ